MSFSCGKGVQFLFSRKILFNLRFITRNLDQKIEVSQQHIHCDSILLLILNSLCFLQSASWTDWAGTTRNVCCPLMRRATAHPVVLRNQGKCSLITPGDDHYHVKLFHLYNCVPWNIMHCIIIDIYLPKNNRSILQSLVMDVFSSRHSVLHRKPLPRTVFAALDQVGRWNKQIVMLEVWQRIDCMTILCQKQL